METINRIPIQHAMFVQSNTTTGVNNDFQDLMMQLFAAQPIEVGEPIVEQLERDAVYPEVETKVISAEDEVPGMEMMQILSSIPNLVLPQAVVEPVQDNKQLANDIRYTETRPIPIKLESKPVVEIQTQEVMKEFTHVVKTIQTDIHMVSFEPETQEAKLHFERLRKPMHAIVQAESVQVKGEVRIVDKVDIPQIERASIDLNELVSIVKRHDQSKDGTYTLKLKPEGIGEIVIKFEQKENSFKLTLNSPHAEVHRLFEKVLPELKNQMQDIQWEIQYGQSDARKHEQPYQQHKQKFRHEEQEEPSINIRIDHYDRSQT